VVILGGSEAVFVSSRGAGDAAVVDFDLCRPADSGAADVATAVAADAADATARAGLFAAVADDAPHVISAAITLAIRRRSKSYSAQ